jgi:type 1 glutamine amidotransferase
MKQALIVWGGWPGHQPDQCAEIVAGMLREDGVEAVIENTTEAFADPKLSEFSLIVPIVTMSTIEKEELEGLLKAVESGVGMAGFHGGMADSFRQEVKYQFMIGGQWVAHPGGVIDFTVNVTRRDDPIMEGIDDFPFRSEQYYMHVDVNNEVLATTTFSDQYCSWIKGHTSPVVWKRRHGKGRIFYCSLGHQAHEFDVPQMKTIVHRGMRWAIR